MPEFFLITLGVPLLVVEVTKEAPQSIKTEALASWWGLFFEVTP